jgi:hypothetical protein
MKFGLNIPKLLKINIQSVLAHNKPFGLQYFVKALLKNIPVSLLYL